jgi:ABC-2 type transport system permease protein
MSVRVVAKRTVLDPYRSRGLWVVLGIFGLLFGLIVYARVSRARVGREIRLANMLVNAAYVFVPIVVIATNYNTIANRRQNGSVRTMLSYPHSRRELVLGTAIGRTLVTVVTISFGFLVASGVYLAYSGVPPIKPLLRGWLAVLLLGMTMTGLSIGISAGARTTNRAGLLSFFAFLLFFVFWQQTVLRLDAALDRFFAFSMQTKWVEFLLYLNPLQAYFAVVGELAPYQTGGVDGFYATEWFGIIVLLAWIVLPLLIGLWQFGRSDL